MPKKKRNVVTRDKLDRQALEQAMKSQGNAIPAAVAVVMRLAAPILAALVVRYVSRKTRRPVSDQTVSNAQQFAGSMVGAIIERAAEQG